MIFNSLAMVLIKHMDLYLALPSGKSAASVFFHSPDDQPSLKTFLPMSATTLRIA